MFEKEIEKFNHWKRYHLRLAEIKTKETLRQTHNKTISSICDAVVFDLDETLAKISAPITQALKALEVNAKIHIPRTYSSYEENGQGFLESLKHEMHR